MKKALWILGTLLVLLVVVLSVQAEEDLWVNALENDRMILAFSQDYSELSLTDKKTGKIWYSSVQTEQIPEGTRINKTWQKRSKSLMLINYTDAEANTGEVKTTDMLSQAYTYCPTEEGEVISILYDFSDIALSFCVNFSLDDDSLVVKIPEESLAETGINRLVSIQLLPFLGSTNDWDEGYFLYPNGCGELYYFKEEQYRSNALISVTLPVYASHITQNAGFPFGSEGATLGHDGTTTAALPAYGIRQNGVGLAAVVEEGDTDCDIVISPAGVSLPVNRIYPKLVYRNNYGVRGQSINVAGTTELSYTSVLVDKNLRPGDRVVRYYVLDEEDADYSGMARAVRESYMNRGILKNSAKMPQMILDVLVGVEKQQVLSKELLTLTTFAQAKEMTEYFLQQGYNGISLNLKGWNANGVLGYPHYSHVSGAAGGEDELKTLAAFCDENKIPFRLQMNAVKLRDDNKGFLTLTDAARDSNGYTFTITTKNHIYYLQNASFRQNLLNEVRTFSDSILSGLTMEDMGLYLYDDFSKQVTMRSELATEWRTWMSEKDAVIGGNACEWGEISLLREIPDTSDLSYFGDESVPFYQMVVHGSIAYTGQPVNLFYDAQGQLLKMLEYGFVPCYELTWDGTSSLMGTEYNLLFSGKFSTWKDQIRECQTLFCEFSALTEGKPFTNHSRVAEDVYLSQYGDVSIFVNYSSVDFDSQFGTVSGEGYLIVREGGHNQ